jgi:hypothetical protein
MTMVLVCCPTTVVTMPQPLTRRWPDVGYADLRKEQETLRAQGRYLGIGISSYVEICGVAPTAWAMAKGGVLVCGKVPMCAFT